MAKATKKLTREIIKAMERAARSRHKPKEILHVPVRELKVA